MLLSQHVKWISICGVAATAIGVGLYVGAPTPMQDTVNISPTSFRSNNTNNTQDELANELKHMREETREQMATMQAIAKQINSMQEQQKKFDQQLNSLQDNSALKNTHHSVSEPPDDGLTDEERLKEYHRQTIAGAEEKIQSESTDQAWSHRMEAELTASMATIDIEGSQLTFAQCATSLCKIRVDHQNQADMTQFLYKLPTVKPWDTGAYIETEQQGTAYITTIYLAREGKDLPEPARPR